MNQQNMNQYIYIYLFILSADSAPPTYITNKRFHLSQLSIWHNSNTTPTTHESIHTICQLIQLRIFYDSNESKHTILSADAAKLHNSNKNKSINTSCQLMQLIGITPRKNTSINTICQLIQLIDITPKTNQ